MFFHLLASCYSTTRMYGAAQWLTATLREEWRLPTAPLPHVSPDHFLSFYFCGGKKQTKTPNYFRLSTQTCWRTRKSCTWAPVCWWFNGRPLITGCRCRVSFNFTPLSHLLSAAAGTCFTETVKRGKASTGTCNSRRIQKSAKEYKRDKTKRLKVRKTVWTRLDLCSNTIRLIVLTTL